MPTSCLRLSPAATSLFMAGSAQQSVVAGIKTAVIACGEYVAATQESPIYGRCHLKAAGIQRHRDHETLGIGQPSLQSNTCLKLVIEYGVWRGDGRGTRGA